MAKRAADSYRMDVRDLVSFATVFALCLILYCIYWFTRFLMREGFIGQQYWITTVPRQHEIIRAQLPGQFHEYYLPGGPVPMYFF